jgi:hypothetical protein
VQEDLQLVVPVLDAFSNMNLEPELFDQVNISRRVVQGFLPKSVSWTGHMLFLRRFCHSLYFSFEESHFGMLNINFY